MIYDSFSSQTWAILYLTETLIKSQYWAPQSHPPVKCQNQDYFQITWFYHNTILNIQMKWVPDVIKNTSRTFLKTSESEEFIGHNIFSKKQRFSPSFVKEWYFFLNFDQILQTSTNFDIWVVGDFAGLSIDFWLKFLLGTKSPMSGKRISPRSSVFQKNQAQ